MKVQGYVNRKKQVVYQCPSCQGKHTHGWVAGEEFLHRVSHCPVNEESVEIQVLNFKEASKPLRQRNAEAALAYYYRKRDEVLRTKLMRRMEREQYCPKASTLLKYNISTPPRLAQAITT